MIPYWLSRFVPVRLRSREALNREARRELWERVGEHDPCLRAVLEIESEMLQAEFHVLVNPQSDAQDVDQARAGLRKAFYTMHVIEAERAAALEARQRREAEMTKTGRKQQQ